MPFIFPAYLILGIAAFALFLAFMLRRVVPTNEVHIVQSRKDTKSYGKDTSNGNTYYEWPSWVPVVGVTKIVLPVSVFDINLIGYEAYDVGRVPFVVDIVAFFRIADSNLAAQRVESFEELENQLLSIIQGAVRTILASHDIDRIMLERSIYGEQFTLAVEEQLKSWGVLPVKSIELMDIRDASGNQVIHNIMEKKKSLIEMQSRQEVAENIKNAQIAEIQAQRERDLKEQEALQAVGERTAIKTQAVGIANETAAQQIKEQQRITKEKEMAVIQVNDVKRAEINKDMNVVKADEDRATMILRAEGHLEAKRKEAEALKVEGEAKAVAERAMQLAPVQAQIELAKEIGENKGYQSYLVSLEAINANKEVGLEQAGALKVSDIKIIVNSGTPVEGVTNVMDMFTAKGGTNIAAMLEGLNQTEQGQALLERLGVNLKPKMDFPPAIDTPPAEPQKRQ